MADLRIETDAHNWGEGDEKMTEKGMAVHSYWTLQSLIRKQKEAERIGEHWQVAVLEVD